MRRKDTFEVWHLKHEKFPEFNLGLQVEFPRDFELAARVNAFDLEDAVTLTTSVVRPWWENAAVECVKQTRSTTANDVVSDGKGNVYLVDDGGLSRVRAGNRDIDQAHEITH